MPGCSPVAMGSSYRSVIIIANGLCYDRAVRGGCGTVAMSSSYRSVIIIRNGCADICVPGGRIKCGTARGATGLRTPFRSAAPG